MNDKETLLRGALNKESSLSPKGKGGAKRRIGAEVFLFALAVLCSSAHAADLSISVQVDKNLVTLDDQVRMDVQVAGPASGLPEPRLPSIPNFNVSSIGTAHNISMVNGRVESSMVYSFILTPRFVGKAVIGPITAEADGKTVGTDPFEIQVSRPSNATNSPNPVIGEPRQQQRRQKTEAQAGPDVFMEAKVSKSKAYVNEQITLTVKFYQGVPLIGNPDYNPPDTSGFFAELLPQTTYNTTLHGRPYNVVQLQYALFGTTAGRRTIGRGVVNAQVPHSQGLDPYASDFFQKFFQYGAQGARPVEIKTDPIDIEVLPLPDEGKPRDFNGAVGLYTLSAILSRSDMKVGDALDLNLIIEGVGNLKTVFAPKIPDMPAFRVYDTLASLNLKKEGGLLHGAKTFKTVLVPRATGKLSIPALTFSFFDPNTKSYRTRSVGPLPVKVEASTDAASALPSGAGPLRGAVAVESDIQFIKDHTLRRPWSAALGGFGSLGLLHALPGLMLMGAGVLFWLRERSLRADPKVRRFKEASKRAQSRLASILKDSRDGSIQALGETLYHYLADKLGVSPHGLTLKQAIGGLKRASPSIPEGHLQELQSIWHDLDSLKYAQVRSDTNTAAAELAHRIEALIDLFEKEIRP